MYFFFLRRARVRGKRSNHIKNEREASEIPRTVHLLYTLDIHLSSLYICGIYRSADARFENSISLNEIRFRERRPRCLYKWHRANVNSRDRGIYTNVCIYQWMIYYGMMCMYPGVYVCLSATLRRVYGRFSLSSGFYGRDCALALVVQYQRNWKRHQ